MLEELDVWEGEEEEATAGLRWDSREPSKACSDRYGAKNRRRVNNHIHPRRCGGSAKQDKRFYLDRSDTLAQKV